MTLHPDVWTSGSGECEDAVSPSKQLRPVQRENVSPESKVNKQHDQGGSPPGVDLQSPRSMKNIQGKSAVPGSHQGTATSSPEQQQQVQAGGMKEAKMDVAPKPTRTGKRSPFGEHAIFGANPLPGHGHGGRGQRVD